ncbi:MAG TPA: hypothetical protein VK081_00860 [Planctomycetota bacterium]|nr:hypothetical protein [Planctomycetota bacterium]
MAVSKAPARLRGRAALPFALAPLAASACTAWFFSGVHYPANDRPVMRLETRGGVEMGVGTQAGVLFLGRTAQQGPCRIHYWLGPTPLVEDGTVEPWGGVFFRAAMDLNHQYAPFLDRDLRDDDELFALLYDGTEVSLQRAQGPGVAGDVVHWPGRDLPAGTGVFVRDPEDGGLRLVGMIAGRIDAGDARYLVHTGTTALREALLAAKPHAEMRQVKHRPDDITVDRLVPR